MNLVAIALLCQVVGNYGGLIDFDHMKANQLACQKYYVSCWNDKRKEQLKYKLPYDGDQMLSECVLERK